MMEANELGNEFEFDGVRRRRKRHNPRLITVSEAAERMGLSPNCIRWNISQGFLDAHFNGYRYAIDLNDLKAFKEVFYE